MNAAAEFPPVTVGLLALPESTPATLYGLYEVFSAVGVTWPTLTGEPAAGPRMDARIVSLDGMPLLGALGLPNTMRVGGAAVQVRIWPRTTSLDCACEPRSCAG